MFSLVLVYRRTFFYIIFYKKNVEKKTGNEDVNTPLQLLIYIYGPFTTEQRQC